MAIELRKTHESHLKIILNGAGGEDKDAFSRFIAALNALADHNELDAFALKEGGQLLATLARETRTYAIGLRAQNPLAELVEDETLLSAIEEALEKQSAPAEGLKQKMRAEVSKALADTAIAVQSDLQPLLKEIGLRGNDRDDRSHRGFL